MKFRFEVVTAIRRRVAAQLAAALLEGTTNVNSDTITAKPITHQADLAKLPRALAPLLERPQWAIWRWTPKPGGDWQKPPFMATEPGRHVSITNPGTWSDYSTALVAVQAGHGDGLSFIQTKNDPLGSVDMDHCRDAVTGSVDWWAQLMFEQALHSYAEITPSGNGLRNLGHRHRCRPAPQIPA